MKNEAIIGVLLMAVFGGVLLYGIGALPVPRVSRTQKLFIEVDYDGSWSGAISQVGSTVSWSGEGRTQRIVERPKGQKWIISFNAQKQDDSNKVLTVRIRYMDGSIAKESSTTAPYGVAQLAVEVR